MTAKALVLAAGKSTRISAIAGDTPKPLLEIAGEPVLVHNLKLLKQHGIHDVWVNLHYQPEKIKNALGDGSRWGLNIQYSHEPEILGTAGAVAGLQKELGTGTFLVLYGDNFSNCNLQDLLARHRQSKALVTVTVFDLTQSQNSGIAGGRIVVNQENFISQFVEGAAAQTVQSNLVNAGIYALEPGIFKYLSKGFSDFGKDIFPLLLGKNQKILSYCMQGYCLAVDTPEAFQKTQQLFK